MRQVKVLLDGVHSYPFLRQHYPLTCPLEFYALYDPSLISPPKALLRQGEVEHPVLKNLRLAYDYDAPFSDGDKQVAIASYYGFAVSLIIWLVKLSQNLVRLA